MAVWVLTNFHISCRFVYSLISTLWKWWCQFPAGAGKKGPARNQVDLYPLWRWYLPLQWRSVWTVFTVHASQSWDALCIVYLFWTNFKLIWLYICIYIYIYTLYICTRPCHLPSPPWDGSRILPPYEIFPLPPLWCGGGVALFPSPPCGVVGVWYCPPTPLWCGGGVVLFPFPPCGVVGVWYGMLGMYGVYGRSGMACLESMVCLVCMVGMVCMAWMVGIVWMVGMVCKSVGYGMFDMTVCMVCMVCMVTMMGMECFRCKVGMVCMAWMFGIVCMVSVVIMFHMYGMCGMYDRYGIC